MPQMLPASVNIGLPLADFNQAAIGRGLQINFFKPGTEVARGSYAELHTAFSMTGTYQNLREFAFDMQNLPALIIIENFSASSAPGSEVVKMDGVAISYRLLEAISTSPFRVKTDRTGCNGHPPQNINNPFSLSRLGSSTPLKVQADHLRKKEPLEAFPLESLRFVTTMKMGANVNALIRAGNSTYMVKVGNYMGKNSGKVMNITENEITLIEMVPDDDNSYKDQVNILKRSSQ
jgi:Tfp pilus assembly protein PilP